MQNRFSGIFLLGSRWSANVCKIFNAITAYNITKEAQCYRVSETTKELFWRQTSCLVRMSHEALLLDNETVRTIENLLIALRFLPAYAANLTRLSDY
jgi:hypothetical protein